MPRKMVDVQSCDVTECSYNNNNACHAIGITIGNGGHPQCDTFLHESRKGGVPDMTGGVGACKAYECKYNDSFECSAGHIEVRHHGDHADCSTYTK